jgi:GDP-L-fucose synthase
MSLGNEQWQRETEPQRSHLNAGFGSDVSILELAHAVANTIGFTGEIKTDTSKPDGPPQKLMDSSRLNQLGWTPEVSLEAGLKLAYSDFLSQLEAGRLRAA